MQIYLLTVLITILAGMTLAEGFLSKRFERYSDHTAFMTNSWYRILLGFASILIGFINFFPTYPEDIAIVGELLPSLGGLVAGSLLIIEHISKQRHEKENRTAEIASKVENFSGPYHTIVGITVIFIGILHAIFPQTPIL